MDQYYPVADNGFRRVDWPRVLSAPHSAETIVAAANVSGQVLEPYDPNTLPNNDAPSASYNDQYEWRRHAATNAERGICNVLFLDGHVSPARQGASSISTPLLDAESIGKDSSLVLRALSADYQHVLSVSSVSKLAEGKMPAEAAPAADQGLSATFKQDGADLAVKVTTAKPVDLDTVLLFFDIDCDASTGFLPPADPHYAFDMMIQFAKAASCYCSYGADRSAELSHFDAVILHTPAQTPSDVKKLNDIGVVTIGCISAGEDDQVHVGNGKGPGGKASWYFDKTGRAQADKNGAWNSWYANAADAEWRANRVAEARRLCDDSAGGIGFAGVFLDTIETCDACPKSRAGMIQLVSELRAASNGRTSLMPGPEDILADISSTASS